MSRMFWLLLLCVQFNAMILCGQNSSYITKNDIHYYSESINNSDSYINERCVLDIYYPKNSEGFATLVWFHGGGLTGGNKEIPSALKEKGIAVVQ